MIEIRDLTKSFGEKDVLKGISAKFYPGKANLIIGTSGSGKTVTIKCMVGLFEPSSGDIFYDQTNFTALSKKERKPIRQQIGMLFQGSALFDSKTVEENVAFPLQMFTTLSAAEIKDRVAFCLERVNLTGVNGLFPSEISGGMQKRVGIARAIALNGKYLFVDEPNSGLDPKTAIVIDHLIKEISEEYNITTVINTHDMNSIFEMGDNIIYLHQGRKLWEGPPQDIKHSDVPELLDFIFASKLMQDALKHI